MRLVCTYACICALTYLWTPRAWSNPGNSENSEEVAVLREEASVDPVTYIVTVQAAVHTEPQNSPEQLPPIEWLESRGKQCYRKWSNHQFCQGPRRAPRPRGPDAALAAELGLGRIETMWRLMLDPPDPRWVAAAGAAGEPRELLWPLPGGKLLRGVGAMRRYKRVRIHKGIDIGPADNSVRFYSVSDGIVAYADNQVRGYGNLIAVVHPDGSAAFYAHAKELYLFAGQRVRRGQVLGEVGKTGFAWGPHLHFEYRVNGRPTNPLKKFAKQ